jgi:hypothetical protein
MRVKLAYPRVVSASKSGDISPNRSVAIIIVFKLSKIN